MANPKISHQEASFGRYGKKNVNAQTGSVQGEVFCCIVPQTESVTLDYSVREGDGGTEETITAPVYAPGITNISISEGEAHAYYERKTS